MRFLFVFLFFVLVDVAYGQTPVRLFSGEAPDENKLLQEFDDISGDFVGGKNVCRKTNVMIPTITVYKSFRLDGKSPAMLVCPGGGYNILAYDLEGTEICEWLNQIGITAVLLKYRVLRRVGREKHEAPLQDAQRALRYIRFHADSLNIFPDKIGVMGFSAGAHLSVMLSSSFYQSNYECKDSIDAVSCRPDFCLLLYPAYLDEENFKLAPDIKICKDIPPTLMIQAEDDNAYINSSLFYYYALKNAGVPAWMHLHSKGGHGYGIRNTGNMIDEWPLRACEWLKEIGILH